MHPCLTAACPSPHTWLILVFRAHNVEDPIPKCWEQSMAETMRGNNERPAWWGWPCRPVSGHKIKIRIPSADLPAPLGPIIQCTSWYLIKRSGHNYTRAPSPSRSNETLHVSSVSSGSCIQRCVTVESLCEASDSCRFDLRSQSGSYWLSVLVEAEVSQYCDLDIMRVIRNVSKQTFWIQQMFTHAGWRSFRVCRWSQSEDEMSTVWSPQNGSLTCAAAAEVPRTENDFQTHFTLVIYVRVQINKENKS